MKKIPIITCNSVIVEAARKIPVNISEAIELSFFDDYEEAVFYLNYEVPEIKILNFADKKLNCPAIADVVRKDLWLHPGGIIALVETEEEKLLMEENQDPSLLIVLTVSEFIHNFERLLKMLMQNSNFLFNRRMQRYLELNESGLLTCNNEPLDLLLYANLLASYLFNTNRIGKTGRYRLKTALIEMLFNALEHGNCGITYAQKSHWLENGGDILELIAEKNKDYHIAARTILLAYQITPHMTRFSITDEGAGFDWRARIGKKVEPGVHGMGIRMTANFVKKMAYNDRGNQVLFEIENQEYQLNAIPAIFTDAEIVNYNTGEVVCREHEETDDLFFIVSGYFDVSFGGKLISLITPKDIFIGEMSFLVDGRRSATISAATPSRLIKIPKNDFMRLIRKNPHYGLFLAKLLAQRLIQQNRRYVESNPVTATINNKAQF